MNSLAHQMGKEAAWQAPAVGAIAGAGLGGLTAPKDDVLRRMIIGALTGGAAGWGSDVMDETFNAYPDTDGTTMLASRLARPIGALGFGGAAYTVLDALRESADEGRRLQEEQE